MRNKQKINSRFSLKWGLKIIPICVLSLMLLPTHAEEKTAADIKAAAAIAAAVAAVPRAPNNKNNKPEAVVE